MPELSSVFSLVNYAFVLFFGIVAALYLADIGFCDHKPVSYTHLTLPTN